MWPTNKYIYGSSVADLGDPSMAPNFLNFKQFFTKFGKSYVGAPLDGLCPPPRGNAGFFLSF